MARRGAGLDRHLEAFTAVASRAEIEHAVEAVLRLRTLIRAVNDQRVAPYDARWSRYVEDGVAAFLADQSRFAL